MDGQLKALLLQMEEEEEEERRVREAQWVEQSRQVEMMLLELEEEERRVKKNRPPEKRAWTQPPEQNPTVLPGFNSPQQSQHELLGAPPFPHMHSVQQVYVPAQQHPAQHIHVSAELQPTDALLDSLLQQLEATQEYEAGSNAEVAKDLLTRYGGAYLGTSIALSLVSFSLCYLLVDQGVDVAGLLDSFGLHVDSTGEAVGTFAIAYAAHKALSPVRFPPTVALTPVVAGWLGKNKEKEEGSKGE
ncbi:unnamed protein product [Closterium sp. Yama58-4]|nr:unnamed protein product [Closterium sp. Yama58-4]